MSKFLSKRFLSLIPYAPGEQPQDMRYIKLNTNESPFPPAPGVMRALNKRQAKKLRLYSDPEAKKSTEAIAEYYGLRNDNIIVTNGSDEVLAFLYMAFCDDEKEIAFPNISYGFYPVFCNLFGIESKIIPLKSDFSIDVEAFCNINKNIVIANPNAPTGIAISLDEIRKIVKYNPNHIVIIDEAYVDFGAESAINLIKEYDNLVVVQTFSKSRSLAGARLGFAIADAEIIKDLNKIKFSFNPYNVNRLTDIAGKKAIEDKRYFERCVKKIIENREYTITELKKLKFEVLPSKANFIFVHKDGLNAKKYYLELKKEGILIRFFDKKPIDNYARISIGTKAQMEILIKKTKEILTKENLL